MSYKSSNTFEKRLDESQRILKKYPEKIPVICEIAKGKEKSDLPKIDKCKFLVPHDLTAGQLLLILRNRMKLSAEKAIFIFIGNTIPKCTDNIKDIYARFKDEDGFLYITYSSENVFGYF